MENWVVWEDSWRRRVRTCTAAPETSMAVAKTTSWEFKRLCTKSDGAGGSDGVTVVQSLSVVFAVRGRQ
ncbi:hypothetical protein Q3G72_007736 [Acer saccharum]|nr:hypothetical protein Q3G72_007736 [Acer saccharum]